MHKWYTFNTIDKNNASVSTDTRKLFFNSSTLFLNAIRQLWNNTIDIPQFKDEIDIEINTTHVYNPVIRYQISQIPLPLNADIASIDQTGPGWCKLCEYNILYLNEGERLKLTAKPTMIPSTSMVVGPCPYIDQCDRLVVSTYQLHVELVFNAVMNRMIEAVNKWALDMTFSHHKLSEVNFALANAIVFFMSDGKKIVVGCRMGHMFLDPIELVVERGTREDMVARLGDVV